MLVYNEAFHAWMQRRGYEQPWLVELMESEKYPINPAFKDRLTYYDFGLDMAEEAMSESIASFLTPLDPVFLAGKRRTANLSQICAPPGHGDRGEKWFGVDGAKTPISDKLGMALIWILENGTTPPPASGLEDWFNRRWAPDRPRLPRVDRLGNPR